MERLTEVGCRDDAEDTPFTPVWGEDGRILPKKGAPSRVPKPRDPTELRTRHRVLGNAWIMAHRCMPNRPWLEGMAPEVWADFTDYVCGDEVARFQGKLPNKRKADPPSWELVLDFEHEMRK